MSRGKPNDRIAEQGSLRIVRNILRLVLLSDSEKKFEKTLDNRPKVWYNKNVPRDKMKKKEVMTNGKDDLCEGSGNRYRLLRSD